MTSLLCIHTHSKHTHTHTCKESYPQLFVYPNVSRHIRSHTHCRCIHWHAHTPSLDHREAGVNRDPGIARWCVQCVCVYRFGVFDLWCCLACVSACVFVFAYMCGRLVLPCFFTVFLGFFHVCSPLDCSPNCRPKTLFTISHESVKKSKKTPAETLDLIMDLLDLIGGFVHTL